jgi:hypothetical protein
VLAGKVVPDRLLALISLISIAIGCKFVTGDKEVVMFLRVLPDGSILVESNVEFAKF